MKYYYLCFIFSLAFYPLNGQEKGTFLDERDLKEYEWIKIGDQKWMAENLDVSTFRNGDPIPEITDRDEWEQAGENGEPAWCYYDMDPKNGGKWGKLYNWHAINDPRGLAPEGWHIPRDEEWNQLTDELGGVAVAGAKMKSKEGWDEDGNGSNESGFTALPSGCRFIFGDCVRHGMGSYWWSSTGVEDSNFVAWFRSLDNKTDKITRLFTDGRLGFSVRCIQD